jgi:hypothetical protein
MKHFKRGLIICLSLATVVFSVFLTCLQVKDDNVADTTFTSLRNVAEVNLNTAAKHIDLMNKQFDSDVTISKTKVLQDFNGNEYAVLEFSPTGYMIYNKLYDAVLE